MKDVNEKVQNTKKVGRMTEGIVTANTVFILKLFYYKSSLTTPPSAQFWGGPINPPWNDFAFKSTENE